MSAFFFRSRLWGSSAVAAFALAVASCATPAGSPQTGSTESGASALSKSDAWLASVAGGVQEDSLRALIQTMVDFGTRHTLSDTKSDTRGIGAARRWVASEFNGMSSACGGCLTIVTPSDIVTGSRVPEPTEVMDVLAIQRGQTDPNRVVIISGHLDSRVTDVMDAVSDAPGANDDASGVAAVMEAARVLSGETFGATIVYAALSGEEQGLLGGQILADYAKAQGWEVEAVLNNDIVGNTHGIGGQHVDDRVRVFSEGVRALETDAMGRARVSTGGELDAPSRNLARYMAALSERVGDKPGVDMIYRRDRFGRGGDQTPMQQAGFPAVRVSEAAENYTRQHQDLREEDGVKYGDTIDGVDFPYLAGVVRLNVMTLASLAKAPPPPPMVELKGAVSADTLVTWKPSPGAAAYRVWWRDTTSPTWTHTREVDGSETQTLLKNTVIDDWFFGVSALSADGFASPVQFAGPVGVFIPSGPAGND
ncbi:MAG: M28 family metallopeptidase [Hyphomonadaceae bacterium]